MHAEYFIYFLDFSKTLSISQTASNFYMTPQGISRAIHSLEKEFGVPLITRSSNNTLSLTAAGAALVPDAEMMEAVFHEAYRHMTPFVSANKNSPDIVVNIKVSAFVSTYLLPLLNLYGSSLFPFSLRIQESNIYKILPKSRVEEHPHSLTLVSIPEVDDYEQMLSSAIESDDLEYRPLLRIPLMALVSLSSPLAGFKQVKMSDIKDSPVILYNDPVLINAIAGLISKKNIVATTSSVQLLHDEIVENHAITFVPAIAQVKGMPAATILKPLVGAYSTRVGFLSAKGAMDVQFGKAVVDLIRDFFTTNSSHKAFKSTYQLIEPQE
jgi:DNA-binding transcriptional LysR family regulator